MAWRNQGITGSNNIPLGKNRMNRGDPSDSPGAPPDEPRKRGRSPAQRERCKLPVCASIYAHLSYCPLTFMFNSSPLLTAGSRR
jgi:hypothetical protein